MSKIKSLLVASLGALALLLFTAPVFAGGGNLYAWSWATTDIWSDAVKTIYIRAHVAPSEPCVGTTVTFKYENEETGDIVTAEGGENSFTFTKVDQKVSKFNGQTIPDCNTYAKFTSRNNKEKMVIIEYKTPDGQVHGPWKYVLNFQLPYPPETNSIEKYPLPWEEDYIKNHPTQMPSAPEMVYPVDGQTIDLEGAYMFKVKQVAGASGYLFGLFQSGVMVYENYRDTGSLSLNGEFALGEDNPAHANFRSGQVEVMVRALVDGKWSEARKIIISLKPRGAVSIKKTSELKVPAEQISAGATDSSALQRRIDELQKKLEQSQQRQSVLENRLNEIIIWIRSLFPFFK